MDVYFEEISSRARTKTERIVSYINIVHIIYWTNDNETKQKLKQKQ